MRSLPEAATKWASSTLHDQLAAQDAVVMSSLKEPNFFSDDGWKVGAGA